MEVSEISFSSIGYASHKISM